MKKIIALTFNVLVSLLLTAAMGAPAILGVGAGLLVGALPGAPSGSLAMGLNVELWQENIVEPLFADNSFLSKAFNADMFVLAGKVVHIPQAGSPSNTVKNRAVFPATAVKRADTEVTYALDEYTTDPRRIDEADKVEFSYDKRNSIIVDDKASMLEVVTNEFIDAWSPSVASSIIRTKGAAVAAHLPSATGNRKSFTMKSVSDARFAMNKQGVPKENRYALIDSDMYAQLLDSMTEAAQIAFHSQANVAEGTIGKLYGFSFYERSQAAKYNNATTPAMKTWDTVGAATDNAAALFWQVNSVERALGTVKAFDNPGVATYYGDILSFLVVATGVGLLSQVSKVLLPAFMKQLHKITNPPDGAKSEYRK